MFRLISSRFRGTTAVQNTGRVRKVFSHLFVGPNPAHCRSFGTLLARKGGSSPKTHVMENLSATTMQTRTTTASGTPGTSVQPNTADCKLIIETSAMFEQQSTTTQDQLIPRVSFEQRHQWKGGAGTPPAMPGPSESEANVHADREAPELDTLIAHAHQTYMHDAQSGSNSSRSQAPPVQKKQPNANTTFMNTESEPEVGGDAAALHGVQWNSNDMDSLRQMQDDAKQAIANATKKAAAKPKPAAGVTSSKTKFAAAQNLSSPPTSASPQKSDAGKGAGAGAGEGKRGGSPAQPGDDQNESPQVRQMRAAARPTTDVQLTDKDWDDVDRVVNKIRSSTDELNSSARSGSGVPATGGTGSAAPAPSIEDKSVRPATPDLNIAKTPQ